MLLKTLFLFQQTDTDTGFSTNWWGLLGLILLAFLATWLRRKLK